MLSRKFNIIIIIFVAINFVSYEAQKRCSNCGSFLLKHKILNKQTNTFITPAYDRDRKVWFKDSLVIGEGSHVDIEQDELGKETWKTYVGEYTFINLKTKSFYEYLTFSDTAKIIDRYIQPEIGRNKRGWNFFSTQSIFSIENLEIISDTIIDGVVYKRVMSSKTVEVKNPEEQKILGEKQLQTSIGYLRCDLKSSIYSIDRGVEKKMGCPVIRVDQISPTNNSWIITEIEFLPNKLTSNEIKVFDAWEKNAKNNPVHK